MSSEPVEGIKIPTPDPAFINSIKMKTLCLIVLFAVLSVALGDNSHLGDGRPGCKTELEMSTRIYRNFWDPSAYWKCEKRYDAATLVRCNDGAFQDKLKRCVTWDEWEWEDMVAPPSTP